MGISDHTPIPRIEGKTIKDAFYGVDESGYQFVRLRLTDGSFFEVKEWEQAGEIKYHDTENGGFWLPNKR